MIVKNFKTNKEAEIPGELLSDWLNENAYQLLEAESKNGFKIYMRPADKKFAFYHPLLEGTTNTECLYFEIPDLEPAQNLLDLSQQLGPIVLGLSRVARKFRNG